MVGFDFDRFTKDIIDGFSSVADTVSEAAGSVAESVSGAASDVAASYDRYRDFIEIGRDLFRSGAVASHSGNLSMTDGTTIWVTRTGSRLGRLTSNDVMAVGWEASAADQGASVELVVHRAMYHALLERLTNEEVPFAGAAIVHTHGLQTVFQSMQKNSITPVDSEGLYVLKQPVPVLTPAETIASDDVAALMAQLVRSGGQIGAVRAHGAFAIADKLENAYRFVSNLEYSSSLLTLLEK